MANPNEPSDMVKFPTREEYMAYLSRSSRIINYKAPRGLPLLPSEVQGYYDVAEASENMALPMQVPIN